MTFLALAHLEERASMEQHSRHVLCFYELVHSQSQFGLYG